MFKTARGKPMPVKYWSFAGIMLTYWCPARCASCYLQCSPERTERMPVPEALEIWRQLISASPHGCRVHLTGGEPFGDYNSLIELCRQAQAAKLGPLEKVETNAFWATDDGVIRRRLTELSEAGMQTLGISADPYHQEFVPIERCRLLARVAGEVLGEDRVQVRWRDWLAEGFDTAAQDAAAKASLFASYATGGRDRFCGRAAGTLASALSLKAAAELTDKPCREMLLRGRHVHVGPGGLIMPGTCAGIVLGRVSPQQSVREVWEDLAQHHENRPVLAVLAAKGPVGLMELPLTQGFAAHAKYASKCQLCWEVRRYLAGRGCCQDELGPAWMYQSQPLSRAAP